MNAILTIVVSVMVEIIAYLLIEFLKTRKADKEERFNRKVDERIEKYFETKKKSQQKNKSNSKAKKIIAPTANAAIIFYAVFQG